MMTLIEEIENEAKLSGITPQDVITDWVSYGDLTAEEEKFARDYYAKQAADESLKVKPHEIPIDNTSTVPDNRKVKAARDEAKIHEKPIGQRDLLQWNSNISPVTNLAAHPLAAFSAFSDEVASAIRPDYPDRTFSENYDLAMEKYQKKNPGNPRNIWDSGAITGMEMLGEFLATSGIAPAVSISKNALVNGRKAATLKEVGADALSTLWAYAFPRSAQKAKPLKDAAEAVSKLPTLYTNPYIRGAVENAFFAGIDPELSKADVAANVVGGLGATKALSGIPLLANRETREGLIDDGLAGVRQVIDAPKQGPHADRYTEALPWVLENLETRHWQGGGPRKTLQNLEKSADDVMNEALNVEKLTTEKLINEGLEVPHAQLNKELHIDLNPNTYQTKIAKKDDDVQEQLSARVKDAIAILEDYNEPEIRESALETLSFVYDEAMKRVRSPDPVLRLTGEKIIADRNARLLSAFGKDGAEKIQEALFKKSVADSYKTRINLGEINAAKKDIHRVAKEHVFTPFIKAADLGEGPNALVRAAYPIVKDDSNERIDWLQSFTQPF